MKVIDLPEGRETDAIVGEKIMNLNIVHHQWPQGYYPDDCGPHALHFMTKEEAETLSPSTGSFEEYLGPVHLEEHGIWPPEVFQWGDNQEYHCLVQPVEHYSTELTSAWRLMDKLGGCVVLYYTDNKQDYWDEPHWVCGLKAFEDGPEYDWDVTLVRAPTAPLAICRAALLAMGYDNV